MSTELFDKNPLGPFVDLSKLGQPPVPPIVIEPWMKEFVKGRHHPDEWEAFFAYVQLSPWKRGLSWFYGFWCGLFNWR